MADIKQIQVGQTTYDIVDEGARTLINNLPTTEGVTSIAEEKANAAQAAAEATVDAKNYFNEVAYDGETKRINFKKDDTVVKFLDATPFIKDGMVSNVEITTAEGVSYLTITFNTDAGKEAINLPLTDIFNAANYYTKNEVDTALGGKQATLVSGTNIKTINGQSVLGEGNIVIEAGETVPTNVSAFVNDAGYVSAEVSGTTLILSTGSAAGE